MILAGPLALTRGRGTRRNSSVWLSLSPASRYPAVTLLLSFGVIGERLRPHQLVSVGPALTSVALIAA